MGLDFLRGLSYYCGQERCYSYRKSTTSDMIPLKSTYSLSNGQIKFKKATNLCIIHDQRNASNPDKNIYVFIAFMPERFRVRINSKENVSSSSTNECQQWLRNAADDRA